MNAHPKLSRRQFLVLSSGVTATALLAACAPAAPAAAPAGEGAAPAEQAVTNLIAWFTDRSTINKMTEQEAIPEFEAANAAIKVELQFVPESRTPAEIAHRQSGWQCTGCLVD